VSGCCFFFSLTLVNVIFLVALDCIMPMRMNVWRINATKATFIGNSVHAIFIQTGGEHLHPPPERHESKSRAWSDFRGGGMYGACPTHRIRPHPCRSRAQSQDKATQAAHREEEDDDDDDDGHFVSTCLSRERRNYLALQLAAVGIARTLVFSLYYQQ
jgi:hypothetical protein